MSKIFLAVLAALATDGLWAHVQVENVRLEQNKSTRDVTVLYDLSGDDAVVTFDVLTNGVSIGGANIASVYGDVNKLVEAGIDRQISWRALSSWPNIKIKDSSVNVKVTAWPVDDPPPVMVVDLTRQNGGRTFYEDFSQVPLTVTNDLYKTDRLVFRKIPAKGEVFTMGGTNGLTGGAKPHKVAFTNDFYLGIYEVTQKQLEHLTSLRIAGHTGPWRGSKNFLESEDADCLPADCVSYGAPDKNPQKYYSLMAWNAWNTDTRAQGTRSVYANSILAHARSYTSLQLDIPTSAQWEFACRAGESGPYYNGKSEATLGDIAWYSGNSGNVPHPVGTREPNAWGLYDMIGNVHEWTLDYAYSSAHVISEYEIDPPGPPSHSSNSRVARGRSFADAAKDCTIWGSTGFYVQFYSYNSDDYHTGFRLWAPVSAR
jgi:formylglycine-generating enzyme required for sulfatase activity